MKSNRVTRHKTQDTSKLKRGVCFCVMATLCLLSLATSAWAAIYYVDPVNGNDSNAGTEVAAWKTIAKVQSASQISDTIIIRNMDATLTNTDWPARIYKTNQISQFGITWTFNADYTIGQFATRDMWAVGNPSVTIIGIYPPSNNIDGRIKNGSQINPSATLREQGYDNSMTSVTYTAALNVALDVSAANPLVVPTNSSLVSTISMDVAGQLPQLKTAAILTVLPAAASHGDFRPPYVGSSKTIKFNAANLNYSKLASLAPVGSGNPTLATMVASFEKPWLDHISLWSGEYCHPADNLPDYGRDLAKTAETGILGLNLNYTNQEKAPLLKGIVQYGIDSYGIIENGQLISWLGEGGFGSGRKLAILLAGSVLNDSSMLGVGARSGDYLYSPGYDAKHPPADYIHFGEDDQTFYVSQYDVDITNGPTWSPDSRDSVKTPYSAEDIGLPEWGIRHCLSPEKSNKYWDTKYRRVSGCTMPGTALAVLMLGLKIEWNHNAFFDFSDRYMATTAVGAEWEIWGTGVNSPGQFVYNMWDAYRANYGRMYIGLDSVTHQRIYSDNQGTILFGDVSGEGEVSAYDAALTAQSAVGLITLTAEQTQAAEVSGEGEVSAYDAALIAQRAVGLISKFPVES